MFQYELHMWQLLFSRIHLEGPKQHEPDIQKLKPKTTKIYITKSAYTIIQECLLPQSKNSQIFNIIWNKSIPLKVGVFLWRLFLDKLSSRINLLKWNIIQESVDILCPWCRDSQETTAHVLFSCKMIEPIWKKLYKGEGYLIVLPQDPSQHLYGNTYYPQQQQQQNQEQDRCYGAQSHGPYGRLETSLFFKGKLQNPNSCDN